MARSTSRSKGTMNARCEKIKAPQTFSPGDNVYHVGGRAGERPYLQPIRVGVFIGPDPDCRPEYPKAIVHFGWLAPESEFLTTLFATEEEARAMVVALAKKRLETIRAEVKRLESLDPSRINTQDRTGQIKKREMERIRGGGQ